ncbi:MAG: outer membrane beta-barrel protein [Bacteroidales bacterium]|nr:outer membrane beta-barrel protein [Bacteroidales bacterium]
MKRFDDIFARKVKDEFNNYNVDHLADDAWKAFIAQKRRRPAFIIPLWAKAASVAVLITAAGIIAFNTFISEKDALNEMAVITEQQADPGEEIEKDIAAGEASERATAAGEAKEMPADNTGSKAESVIIPDISFAEEQPLSEPEKPERVTMDKLPALIAGIRLINLNELIEARANPGIISYYEPFTETTSKERKTDLMAGLSGMVSRVDDNSDPGTSMGVYLDRKLSDRLSLRPGLAFSYQGHNLSGNSALKADMAYAVPQSNFSSVDVESNSAQLDLLAFEIPLNLVYTVWERRRSKVYLSAGASTMVYLNQKFDGNYTNTYYFENYDNITGDVRYDSNSTMVDVESSYGAFSHVDFMGLANLSAGYSMPLGGKNNILFEPFIKLPVSGLTSLDLRVYYGGISFKLRFLDQK